MRPEIGAHLDHVVLAALTPERVAHSLGAIVSMAVRPHGDAWLCEGPARTLLVTAGRRNTVALIGFRFDDQRDLEAYRARLQSEDAPLRPSSSTLFGATAFELIDPDGMRIAFGVRRAHPLSGEAATLQHLGVRTTDPERMQAFYQDTLHFVLSDRIEDDVGILRAAFLRSDAAHHAIAIFRAPESRLDHLSFDAPDMIAIRDWADHVGRIKVPIFWGVGRHGPGNDLFFMVQDVEENLVEISSELEVCAPERPASRWPYNKWTMNLWGIPFMRS